MFFLLLLFVSFFGWANKYELYDMAQDSDELVALCDNELKREEMPFHPWNVEYIHWICCAKKCKFVDEFDRIGWQIVGIVKRFFYFCFITENGSHSEYFQWAYLRCSVSHSHSHSHSHSPNQFYRFFFVRSFFICLVLILILILILIRFCQRQMAFYRSNTFISVTKWNEHGRTHNLSRIAAEPGGFWQTSTKIHGHTVICIKLTWCASRAHLPFCKFVAALLAQPVQHRNCVFKSNHMREIAKATK